MADTFCIVPFTHLEARADGFVAPCCMSPHFYKKPDGTHFTLARDTLDDVWQSQSVRDLRQSLKSGVQHPACDLCWREEASGKESKRQRQNRLWADQIERVLTTPEDELKPFSLDLKLGNICNLKCRICKPQYSSKWIKEWIDVYGEDALGTIADEVSSPGEPISRRAIMNWFDTNEKFWPAVHEWLPHVEHFEFYGGEPFLIEAHFDLLRRSVAEGWAGNQTVHYSSNGTIYPDEAVRELFPKFKKVDIMLSIDGVGEQFEYQRYGAVWGEVEANIRRFKETMPDDIAVCLTVSSLNVYYLPEYLNYFHQEGLKVWLNILHGPFDFCIANLPDTAKIAVRDKLETIGEEGAVLLDPVEPIISFMMNTEANPINRRKLTRRIQAHDEYRNQNFASVFPKFAELIGYR